MKETLAAIKKAAIRRARSVPADKLFAGVDTMLVRCAVDEVRGLLRRHGSADALAQAVISRSGTANEGVVGAWFLSLLGLHYTVKLAKAMRDRSGLLQGAVNLPNSGWPKYVLHLAVNVIVLIYASAFVLMNATQNAIYFKRGDGRIAYFTYRWSGPHGYVIKDHKGNTVRLEWMGGDRYEAVLGGRTIDVRSGDPGGGDRLHKHLRKHIGPPMTFLGPDGEPILTEVGVLRDNHGHYKVDGVPAGNLVIVEADLTRELGARGPDGVDDPSSDDIRRRASEAEREILRRKTEIDSISRRTGSRLEGDVIFIKESVDQAKRILRDAGIDYQMMSRTPRSDLNLLERRFLEVRDRLEKSNMLGYLGVFAKVLAELSDYSYDGHQHPRRRERMGRQVLFAERILRIHALLVELEPVIKNLRDTSGRKTTLFDLAGAEQMEDALLRLRDWRLVNAFMRGLPPRQKALVWPDGYWSAELAGSSLFLTDSVIKISKDEERSRTLLSKISAVRSAGEFIREVSRLLKMEPWTFEHWIAKLRRTPGVAVTWHSREKGQIICMVVSWWTIRRIAYMTNWCIVRSIGYFLNYTSNSTQFVLYDFSKPASSNESVIGFTLGGHNDHGGRYNPYYIKHCHYKNDRHARLPPDFTKSSGSRDFVRPEFVEMSLSNLRLANLLAPGVGLEVIRRKIEPLLKRPAISKFIDFWA